MTKFSVRNACVVFCSAFFALAVPASAGTLGVLATSDIYSAGHSSLPATIYPGTFAPSVTFSAGPDQILTFSSVTGMVGCNFVITNGPDGSCGGAYAGVSTTVTRYGGLSGISALHTNFFLVGVFLDNNEPAGPGPAVLTYNYGTSGSLSFSAPAYIPQIDQVFFIGDGLTGTGSGNEQLFFVPPNATRLYLGFADSFDGVPSYYADNVGSLSATFSINTAPEPTSLLLAAGGLFLIGWRIWRRRRPQSLEGFNTLN